MEKKTLEFIGEVMKESVQVELAAIGEKNSNIYKDINYRIDEKNNKVELLIPDYYKFIESGRKIRISKVPIEVLLKWMKRKGIARGRENKVVYAIQRSIYLKGIKPKPFLDKATDDIDEQIETFIEMDFGKELDKKIEEIING